MNADTRVRMTSSSSRLAALPPGHKHHSVVQCADDPRGVCRLRSQRCAPHPRALALLESRPVVSRSHSTEIGRGRSGLAKVDVVGDSHAGRLTLLCTVPVGVQCSTAPVSCSLTAVKTLSSHVAVGAAEACRMCTSRGSHGSSIGGRARGTGVSGGAGAGVATVTAACSTTAGQGRTGASRGLRRGGVG